MAQNNVSFEQGNALYNDGKFAEALDKYEAILQSDKHSSELYFNMANAHYKLNNIAPSIYYYEKAIRLSPKDQDIKNNLAFANNMTIDAIDVLPEPRFSKGIKAITNSMTFDGWAKLTVAFAIVFVLLILVYYFTYSTAKKRLAFLASFASLFLACSALAFTFHNYNLDKKDNPAIVFSKESQVKSEPNLRSEEVFTLHEGTKVQVLESVNDWNKIKLANGKTGWILTQDIKAL